MRKLILAFGLLIGLSGAAKADPHKTYSGNLWSSPGLTYAADYTRDLNQTGEIVGAQVNISSLTTPSKTFTDGSAAIGQFTVSNNTFVRSSTPTISINGRNISYTPGTTSSGTAKAISDAIVANSSLNTIVVSTWGTNGIVYSSATSVGTATNYAMATSSQAALGVSGALMTGGTNSAYTINTPTITIATNGFVTGLQVLFSGTPAISGLTTGTTYYVSLINANNNGISNTFKLSTSLANAQAGTGITLASSQTKTTADTYTLAPLAITGSSVFTWQTSDDNVNWTNVQVSTASLATPYTASVNEWSFGSLSHRYLRLDVTALTTGAQAFSVWLNQATSYTQ